MTAPRQPFASPLPATGKLLSSLVAQASDLVQKLTGSLTGLRRRGGGRLERPLDRFT